MNKIISADNLIKTISSLMDDREDDPEFCEAAAEIITIIEYMPNEKETLIDRIESLLIEIGQHDRKFKFGETIRYAPHEIKNYLLDEL